MWWEKGGEMEGGVEGERVEEGLSLRKHCYINMYSVLMSSS